MQEKRCSAVESKSYERRPESEKDRKKGIELARAYYEQFGKRMIREQFRNMRTESRLDLSGKDRNALDLMICFQKITIMAQHSVCG